MILCWIEPGFTETKDVAAEGIVDTILKQNCLGEHC